MPRVARIVIPDQPHHVTQRGNNRQEVSASDADRRLYLSLLAEQAEVHGVRLLGYCLMSNHVHLVAVPSDEQGLAKALGRTHYRYTQYVNRSRGWSGHLWQNRFFSCVLDQAHLWKALAYVELNPVRARLVRQAWAYAWSSAAVHVGQQAGPAWLDQRLWKGKWTGAHWREILSHEQGRLDMLLPTWNRSHPWPPCVDVVGQYHPRRRPRFAQGLLSYCLIMTYKLASCHS